MPKVLVFGAGSLGACYAWVLSKAVGEANVTTVCRSNYDAATQHGFTIHSKLWGNNLTFRPHVSRSVKDAVAANAGEPFDYVVIAAKALPTRPSTADLVRPAVAEGSTCIVLVQNGIGIEDPYARAFPQNPLLSAVAYFPATQVRPAVVQHQEIETLHLGTYPSGEAAGEAHALAAARFAELLRSGGATAMVHGDVQRERWVKLLVNAAWNPVCAITRLRDREFMDASLGLGLGLDSGLSEGEDEGDRGGDGLRFIRDVMLEIAAVAQAYGYADINEDRVDFQIRRAAVRELPGIQPSMLADALAGRSMEVDAIVGNVVRMAGRKGVKVPMLRTIYLLANGLSESFSRAKGGS
ncbi:6-phosphogluconate dehydrogenase C-terminal domain-like protein [Hypoxylon sp. NC1633]|nr:6-phosphogluconate dehydrogenase C-terminal domain-like protein [Hypoxylon sp. NC1633]